MKTRKIKPNKQKGGVMILTVVFFLIVGLMVVVGLSVSTTGYLRNLQSMTSSQQSYYVAEAGLEDVLFRLRNDLAIGTTTVLTLAGQVATTTISGDSIKLVKTDSASVEGFQKHVSATVTRDWALSFNYGVQNGFGTTTFVQTSTINGDVYSNGSIYGKGQINGSAIAVKEIKSTLSGGYLTIGTTTNSIVWAPKLYWIKSAGTFYCNTATKLVNLSGNIKNCDTSRGTPPKQDLLGFSTTTIYEWKTEAANSIYQGTLNLGEDHYASRSIGPMIIMGDIILRYNQHLNITGTVWVKGSVIVYGESTISLDPSYGNKSGVILVDESIQVHGSDSFTGSGQADSYLTMVSLAACPNGAPGDCYLDNSISFYGKGGSVVLLAPYGRVELGGANTVVKTVYAGESVEIYSTAKVDYDPDLTNIMFGGGSMADWNILSRKELDI